MKHSEILSFHFNTTKVYSAAVPPGRFDFSPKCLPLFLQGQEVRRGWQNKTIRSFRVNLNTILLRG
jgi:hypothetical protein